jgi:hypothetical protein
MHIFFLCYMSSKTPRSEKSLDNSYLYFLKLNIHNFIFNNFIFVMNTVGEAAEIQALKQMQKRLSVYIELHDNC